MQLIPVFGTLLFIASTINGQCLTDNDNDPKLTGSTDLSGITGFGLELFREIFPYNTSQNFFFSPYSIWNALSLAYFGSKGQTELQLQKVLRVKDKISALRSWRKLQYTYDLRQMNSTDYTFRLANKAYFDKTVQVKPCVSKLLKDEVETLDFTNTETAAKTINDFVANTTKHRIESIVSPGDLSSTKMALVNAAFFKGTWLYQFKKSRTEKQIFYAAPNQNYFVDMMTQKGNFRSGPSEKLGAHILELPYTGEQISMVILLPPFLAGEEGFNNMVERLNAQVLHETLKDLWKKEVVVTLPKFKFQQSVGDELIQGLQKMGIKDLFNAGNANLTLFDPEGHLSVGKAIHKAFVEVNEEGTEAAAATSLIQFRLARPLEPEEFNCNHPFMFVLFDNVTKNILFLGAYKNPKA